MSRHKWDQMLYLAKLQQQEYYELLSEWTKYKKDEYKYLKQNIGFALFGPPTEKAESNVEINRDKETANYDIIEAFHYKDEAQKVIDEIYDKVLTFADKKTKVDKKGDKKEEESHICYGVIFNITIHPPIPKFDEKESTKNDTDGKKNDMDGKKNDTDGKKNDTDGKKNDTDGKKNDTDGKKNDMDGKKNDTDGKKNDTDGKKNDTNSAQNDEVEVNLYTTPIFKILTSENKEWYIDIHGRMYKSWTDYKTSNTLPQCTMVLPMDGSYKPDCNCAVTEDSSSVWLEILESPACSIGSTILNSADTATSIIGMLGLGLTVASMFTPAAPVAIGAMAATGVSGVWATGRAAHNLADRYTHKESINVTNRKAFCAWLSITGGAVGLASAGGNVLLNSLIRNGQTVSRATQMTYNAVLLSNLGVNGFGLGYQAYCMFETYRDGGEIKVIDILSLGTHILFFGNAVVNMQFAGDLIESTQGKILEDYRADIRSKNLRKKFNRIRRRAAGNNPDKMAENAEVIRYINRRIDMGLTNDINPNNNPIKTNIILLDNGLIKICGYSLLDPVKFVSWLIEFDRNSFRGNYSNDPSSSRGGSQTGDMVFKLKDLLSSLLSTFSQNHRTAYHPDLDEFNTTLDDMKYMQNGLLAFTLIFEIATAIINSNSRFEEHIGKAVHFVWCYVRESLRTNALTVIFSVSNDKIQRALERILQNMLDHLDSVEERLTSGIEKYIAEYMRTFFPDL